MSVLGNFVRLEPEKPVILMFDRDWFEEREIVDPITKAAKTVRVLVLHVINEDGKEVDKTYSVISERHAAELMKLKELGVLFTRPIKLTKHGKGFRSEIEIQVL